MKIHKVTCDNCGRAMPEDTEPLLIGRRPMDFCWPCQTLIREGRFAPRDERDDLSRLRVERDRLEAEREREKDMQAIRDHCANAIELWVEGKDPREQITKAAARAAGQRREAAG